MPMTTEAPAAAPAPPSPVPLSEAFRYWLKLGFVSFGGPAGQISMMHTELVERRRWFSEHRFLHALNYTMVLPGPEAQQLATYIGWLMHGTLGGIVAGVLFVLPSLAILITLTWIYLAYGDVPVVAGVLYGIKPAVTAIVVFAAYRIGSRALRNGVLWAMAAARRNERRETSTFPEVRVTDIHTEKASAEWPLGIPPLRGCPAPK